MSTLPAIEITKNWEKFSDLVSNFDETLNYTFQNNSTYTILFCINKIKDYFEKTTIKILVDSLFLMIYFKIK
jgi:hypothetical protein